MKKAKTGHFKILTLIDVTTLHIELIATNGNIQKRILWIDVTSKGVYSAFSFKNRNMHLSYHFDGNIYTNWSGERPQKTRSLQPLNSFQGHYKLSSSAFTSNLSQLHDVPAYNLEKVDAIVNVDTRVYKRGIGCLLYVIERNSIDDLSKIIKSLREGLVTEVHSFLKCNPWISLVLHDQN